MKFFKTNAFALGAVFLVILIFCLPILRGKMPLAADTISGLYHPFRDAYFNQKGNYAPFKNFLITDPIRQIYEWRYLAISSLKDKQFPWWNPYNFSGYPLMANFQTAFFYPLNFLYFLFNFETSWSIQFVLQMVLGAFFMYLFLNTFNLKNYSKALGTLCWIFSGFWISWLTWNTIDHVALWLPLSLFSIQKIFAKNGSGLKFYFLLLFSWLCSFFSGHFQTFGYVFFTSLSYFAFKTKASIRKGMILKLLASILAFFIISSIQSLSTLEFRNLSNRANDQANWKKPEWFLPIPNLIQFLAPDFFGNPATLNYWGIFNYGEFVGYFGIIPFTLALTVFFQKNNIFFKALALVALLLALPTPLAKLPYLFSLPLISSMQPSRIMMLVNFSLATLAAFGLEKLFSAGKKVDLIIIFIWLFFLGLLLVTFSNNSSSFQIAKRNLVFPMLVFAFFSFSWLIKKLGKFPNYFFPIIVFLLTAFDLLRFANKYTSFSDKKLLFPSTKIIQYLQTSTFSDQSRVLGVDYVENSERILPANINSFYKLQSPSGYDPIYLKSYANLIASFEIGKPIANFSFNRIIALQNLRSKLLDFLGVKYILSLNDLKSEKFRLVLKEGETRLYENTQAFPKAFFVYDTQTVSNPQLALAKMLESDFDFRKSAILEKNIKENLSFPTETPTIVLKEYRFNSVFLEVQTQTTGLLVLTDSFYPNWKATLDGKLTEIYKVNNHFRAVVVPSGRHSIRFFIGI